MIVRYEKISYYIKQIQIALKDKISRPDDVLTQLLSSYVKSHTFFGFFREALRTNPYKVLSSDIIKSLSSVKDWRTIFKQVDAVFANNALKENSDINDDFHALWIAFFVYYAYLIPSNFSFQENSLLKKAMITAHLVNQKNQKGLANKFGLKKLENEIHAKNVKAHSKLITILEFIKKTRSVEHLEKLQHNDRDRYLCKIDELFDYPFPNVPDNFLIDIIKILIEESISPIILHPTDYGRHQLNALTLSLTNEQQIHVFDTFMQEMAPSANQDESAVLKKVKYFALIPIPFSKREVVIDELGRLYEETKSLKVRNQIIKTFAEIPLPAEKWNKIEAIIVPLLKAITYLSSDSHKFVKSLANVLNKITLSPTAQLYLINQLLDNIGFYQVENLLLYLEKIPIPKGYQTEIFSKLINRLKKSESGETQKYIGYSLIRVLGKISILPTHFLEITQVYLNILRKLTISKGYLMELTYKDIIKQLSKISLSTETHHEIINVLISHLENESLEVFHRSTLCALPLFSLDSIQKNKLINIIINNTYLELWEAMPLLHQIPIPACKQQEVINFCINELKESDVMNTVQYAAQALGNMVIPASMVPTIINALLSIEFDKDRLETQIAAIESAYKIAASPEQKSKVITKLVKALQVYPAFIDVLIKNPHALKPSEILNMLVHPENFYNDFSFGQLLEYYLKIANRADITLLFSHLENAFERLHKPEYQRPVTSYFNTTSLQRCVKEYLSVSTKFIAMEKLLSIPLQNSDIVRNHLIKYCAISGSR